MSHTEIRNRGFNLGRSIKFLMALLAASFGFAHSATIVTTTAFEYDSISGLVTKAIVEPGNSAMCMVATYALDAYGNRQGATTRNCNGSAGSLPGTNDEALAPAPGSSALFSSRTMGAVYSADARFRIGSSNALGQSEVRTYDGRFGTVTSSSDPNGLVTYWAYDDLGRKVLEKRPDGNGTRWTYKYCSNVTINGVAGTETCPTLAGSVGSYVITTTPVKAPIDVAAKTDGGANGAYNKTYFGTVGQVVRNETQGFDGSGTSTLIYEDTEYDLYARVSRRSRPYYQGAANIYWTSFGYDVQGRVVTETRPDGSKSTTKYKGLVATITNDKGQTVTETRNAVGQVITILDTNGKALTKVWDASGNLLTTTDALGNVTTLTYDVKGRKTQMSDPDMGNWSYVYNALGELTQQTDAKGQVATMTYDVLGRLIAKSEPTQNSNWYYDKYKDGAACPKGIGRLCEVASGNGYGRKQGYDSLGRAISTTTTVGGSYTSNSTYNSDGRLDTIAYPSGNLTLKNVYTAMGYLKQVVNAATPSSVYWKAEVIDAEGHTTQYTTGNLITTLNGYDPQTGRLTSTKAGVSGSTSYAVQNASYGFDTLGNLTSQSDGAAGTSGTYTYDNLNRLASEARLGTAVTTAQSITWGYDEIGNITSRSDVGTYTYPASGAASVRPHAVSSVVGNVNGVASPSYGYDANGNLSSASGRSVIWSSFNKVLSIGRTTGASTNTLAYMYDAGGERVKETYSQNGTPQRTTIYLNPGSGAGLFYEEEITSAGSKKKHYIAGVGVLIFNTANSSWTTQYWHKDSLGSTVAVTDAVGAVTERMSYEPFGKRRNADATTDGMGILMAAATRRGFTGHEMMDEIGLVNMNGRVYDPAIGRFLSADPNVPNPEDMQSYGRYTYVRDNPLNATDPSGFFDDGSCYVCFQFYADSNGSYGVGANIGFRPAPNPVVFTPLPKVNPAPTPVRTPVYAATPPAPAAGSVSVSGLNYGGGQSSFLALTNSVDEWVTNFNFNTRLSGAAQAGMGTLELVGGTVFAFATSETVIGAVAGAATAYTGGANLSAGLQTLWTGKQTPSALDLITDKAGIKPLYAAGIGILLSSGTNAGADASFASIAAKGVTNPEVAKGVFPVIGPLTQRGVGEVIGWGKKGAPDAIAKMESLTAQEVATMQRRGINQNAAGQIRDFYTNEMARNANNPTAAARVDLMNKIIDMMK